MRIVIILILVLILCCCCCSCSTSFGFNPMVQKDGGNQQNQQNIPYRENQNQVSKHELQNDKV